MSKPSFADGPRKSSPAVNAYLQHLQSKKIVDPRQTIAPIERNTKDSSQSDAPPPSASSIPPTSSAASQTSLHLPETAAVPMRSAVPSATSTTTTHNEKRRSRRHPEKPPLGHKQPRSILSFLTNATYLSSDSEDGGDDDTSTATATVHSDGTSHSSWRRHHRRSTGDSRSSGTSPTNTGALIPVPPRLDAALGAGDMDATDHHRNHPSSYYHQHSEEDHDHHHHDSYPTQSYDEEEEGAAFSYSSAEDDDDMLDQLIDETSKRWKLEVHETIQGTVTSASFSSSPVLHRPYAASDTSTRPMAMNVQHSSPDLSNRTASDHLAAPLTSSSSQLIQEQQAEIEALRAALQQQQRHAPPQPPAHPIQILTVPPPDPHGVEDDLTVWSGFHSTAPPPPLRPDAESSHEPPSKNTRHVPRTPRLPLQQTSLRLELSSTVTGLHRSALFTGTIASQQPPTDPSFRTTRANHSITGTGVLQFLESQDVYRGDLVHSEMHGLGTYTFADKKKKVLRGRFAHNSFLGEC